VVFFLAVFFSRLSVVCVFLFFFSSRRRHTRSKRDWSSDVCSSDLRRLGWGRHGHPRPGHRRGGGRGRGPRPALVRRGDFCAVQRSEERRVGKEWRSRRARYQEKKNNASKSNGGRARVCRARTRETV